ncbi:DUF4834 family protein [Bacteroides sp.]|uniref:DUF4834 family protein n=1 Tax=Bacteroides sp. TaxID=29523 RepID=UPI0026199025|nr:DUF4834 family protein [Bacteroides sp.]
MFHILGFLFIIIIAILIIGLSIIGTVLRSIFGLKKRHSSFSSGGYSSYNSTKQSGSPRQQETEETAEEKAHSNKRKKLFSEDEGEYVDFEEVKE